MIFGIRDLYVLLKRSAKENVAWNDHTCLHCTLYSLPAPRISSNTVKVTL